ncbi:hypothetical protein POM88_047770 [Heracleum sosnowskyi]|uniref:Uncharacterized protein n=1 Tax=Heracleum sosnowskyi TaxID=360622 RepID=A0AAD8LZW4_9APIA|nr:hypothetical protein POM88_047770 [Heracleum sosnowskyi]
MENIKKLQPASGVDDPSFDYYLKCKFCEKVGTVTVISGKGRPLTQGLSEQGKYAPLMELDCKGYEPVEFMFGSGWKAESVSSYMLCISPLLMQESNYTANFIYMA